MNWILVGTELNIGISGIFCFHLSLNEVNMKRLNETFKQSVFFSTIHICFIVFVNIFAYLGFIIIQPTFYILLIISNIMCSAFGIINAVLYRKQILIVVYSVYLPFFFYYLKNDILFSSITIILCIIVVIFINNSYYKRFITVILSILFIIFIINCYIKIISYNTEIKNSPDGTYILRHDIINYTIILRHDIFLEHKLNNIFARKAYIGTSADGLMGWLDNNTFYTSNGKYRIDNFNSIVPISK